MTRCRPPRSRTAPSRVWLAPALFLAILAAPAVTADSLPTPAPAAADPVALDKRVIEEAKQHSELMANLTYLSDDIGCRLTGSAALKRANEWAAERMRTYGLTDVRLEGWTIPVGWERGTASMRLVEPHVGPPMTVAAMAWTPSTPGKVTGDVVVLNAKTAKDLAAYKGKLKGAVVLQGAPEAMRPINDGNLFDPNRRGRFGGRRGGAGGGETPEAKQGERPAAKVNGAPDAKTNPAAAVSADAKPAGKSDVRTNPNPAARPEAKPAEKAEAKADPGPGNGPRDGRDGQSMEQMYQRFQHMMAFRKELREFLHNEGVAVLLMDSDKPHGLLNMTGSWPGNDRVSGADPLPTLFVVHEHYSQLYRLATRPGGGHTRVEVEIQSKLIPGPIAVYNTVGELRGAEKPDEYVVLGAHIDSWDLAQGTTDNGTGTCVVLEAARVLGNLSKAGIRPGRTIRFALFSGEEQGLYGSRAYVKQHAAEMPKTSMALVHDTGTGKVVGIGTQGRESSKKILERELVSLKELGCTDFNTRGMGGSDHMSFESAGVPGFAVQQDWDEYRFTHHSQSDTIDKAKEPALIQGAQVLAVAALRVANLPELLPHDKPPRRSPWDRDTPAPTVKAEENAAAKTAKDKEAKVPAGKK